MPEVQVYSDPGALARAAAERFVVLAKDIIAARGRFVVALAGGSTPRAMYTLLASEAFAGRVDWECVHIFWGDERCVPPIHPNSNYRMAHEALLAQVPVPEGNIHRMYAEIEPSRAAVEYERSLRAFFALDNANQFETGGFPSFDLILLGMGDDGHTASLFPGTAAIHERERWVVAHYIEKLEAWRLTLTPPVLNAAANIIFLVSGGGKAERLQQVLRGPYQPDTLPAQIIKPVGGHLSWLVDRAAAELL